jgi:hypothetical protein
MLRIWVLPRETFTTVRLEGRLLAAWRDELLAAVDRATARGMPMRLDLDTLAYADPTGIELLRTLTDARGIEIERCSRFVAKLLNGDRKDAS